MTDQALSRREKSAASAILPLRDLPPSVKHWTSDGYRPPRVSGMMSDVWMPPPAVDAEAAAALPQLIAERADELVLAPREAIVVELASLFAVTRKGDHGMTKGVVNIYAGDLARISHE